MNADPKSNGSNDEDLQWVERFKAGNTHAFDFIVRKYQRCLYRIIYNMVSNKEDAADMLQNVFIKAFQSIQQFKGESNFYTWLYRIAINLTLNFIEKNKKRASIALEPLANEEGVAEFLNLDKNAKPGDRALLLKELQEKLNASLQNLSSIHRTVIVLFEIEGLSHKEIAQILHCTEGTVRSRLHYAKEQLKHSLLPYLKDESERI